MTSEKISKLKFWVLTNRPLTEVAESLKQANIITEFDCDYENVYEWFEGTLTTYDFVLNVSRKHHEGDLKPDEPLGFMGISSSGSPPIDSEISNLAAAVHIALGIKVYLGHIEYLGGDDFRYSPTENLQV